MNVLADTERRRLERHGSASLRAVSGRPTAELRGHRLRVDGHVVSMATPYLTLDTNAADAEPNRRRTRGINDALGLLLRLSDLDLHDELRPSDVFERIVFDVLEQLRCDALAPAHLRGLRANVDAAFEAWSLDARAQRVTENRFAMLVFTTTYMVRARLMGRTLPEDVDELIEATRGHLGPLIGHALRELPATVNDQRAYAAPAREIARLVGEVADDSTESSLAISDVASRHQLLVPADWDTGDTDPTTSDVDGLAPGSPDDEPVGLSLERVGDYRVFTRDYDVETSGAALFRADKLRRLRNELDEMERAQAVSAPRLAQRLLALFGAPTEDDWHFGRDHGVLDGRRLGQLIASPAHADVFKQRRVHHSSNTAITFLVDNSGSMKRQ